MPLTFGLTGMDPATETSLKAAFDQANQRLGGVWQLLPDTQGDYIVVDMDSMYGPMSWLRLHAAGKTVIGLTSAPRTQADYRLAQPVDAQSLAQVLAEISSQAGSTPAPAGLTPAPQPQDQLPEEQPQRVDEEAGAVAAPAPVATEALGSQREPASVAVGQVVPAAPTSASTTDRPRSSRWPPTSRTNCQRPTSPRLSTGTAKSRVPARRSRCRGCSGSAGCLPDKAS